MTPGDVLFFLELLDDLDSGSNNSAESFTKVFRVVSTFPRIGTIKMPERQIIGSSYKWLPVIIESNWLGGRDSNPDRRIQSPEKHVSLSSS